MAKFSPAFKTFAEVEELYSSTNPLRRNKKRDFSLAANQNIRPTNCRARPYERVIKVTRNKYALLDADSMWVPYTLGEARVPKNEKEFNEDLCDRAAIVWERKKNGTEHMTVRNMLQVSTYDNLPIGRMDFLHRHLPVHWSAYCSNGSQYIRNSMGEYVLPRNDFIPTCLVKSESTTRWNYSQPTGQRRVKKELVFVRDPKTNSWSAPVKQFPDRKWRIDREAKAKIKPHADKFYENYAPIGAMLELRAKFELADEDPSLKEGFEFIGDSDTKNILEIMRDPNHTHSLALVHYFIFERNTMMQYYSNAEPNPFRCRKAYNDTINRVFKLRKKMEVYCD